MDPYLLECSLVVFVGPSGAGKDTAMNGIKACHYPNIMRVASETSRAPRSSDRQHYRHLSKDQMLGKQDQGHYAWLVPFDGNYYGTLKSDLISAFESIHGMMIDVTPETLPLLMAAVPEERHSNIIPVFLEASLDRLEHQLWERSLRDLADKLRANYGVNPKEELRILHGSIEERMIECRSWPKQTRELAESLGLAYDPIVNDSTVADLIEKTWAHIQNCVAGQTDSAFSS